MYLFMKNGVTISIDISRKLLDEETVLVKTFWNWLHEEEIYGFFSVTNNLEIIRTI